MNLAEGIEERVKDFESKGEEDLKNAEKFKSDAEALERNGILEKSIEKYQSAANLCRRASVWLGSINMITTGLDEETLERLQLRKTDKKYVELHRQIKNCHKESADLYKKASGIISKYNNKFLQAEMLGMAAGEYLNVFELSGEDELKKDYKTGEVYMYSETLCGAITYLYRSAAGLFNDIGIEFEESGKKSKAYVFYGYMGDAYLSIALVQEKDKYWPSGTSDQAHDYLCAAEAYSKSGKLNREIGVTSIVQYARIEWKHAHRGIFDFFKDKEGYSTADDLKRATMAYSKAKELYEKIGMKDQSAYCSLRIEEIQGILKQTGQEKPVDEAFYHMRKVGRINCVWAERELQKITSKLRNYIIPDDLEHYETVINSILNYMDQNLRENFFKDESFDEKAFHKDLLRHFRADYQIGASAQKEIHTGGGKVDILVNDVPVELKVEKGEVDVDRIIDKNKKQACQYASSQGKQVGILCVLDLTKKGKPIPPPSNDIHIVEVAVHGYEEKQLVAPSMILSFIIRGNMAPPSAL
jgi:hypothetical protein